MSEQRLDYTRLAPEGIAALRSLEHILNANSGLGASLLELVRLRVSLMNGCDFCIGLHTHELTQHNETQDRIAALSNWRESDAYTHRERAALQWAEAVTNIQEGHADDAAYDEVRTHFSAIELVNLTMAIAGINAWNRLAIAFRSQPPDDRKRPADRLAAVPAAGSAPAVAQGDGGKVSVEEEHG